MRKIFALSKKDLDLLPVDVRQQVLSDLVEYDDTHVIFERGKYNVSPSIGITGTYAPDHKFIGCAYWDDFYTPRERKNLQVQFELADKLTRLVYEKVGDALDLYVINKVMKWHVVDNSATEDEMIEMIDGWDDGTSAGMIDMITESLHIMEEESEEE